jgi:antitoxin component YwqK of YwqJK toxin-antitoxin module
MEREIKREYRLDGSLHIEYQVNSKGQEDGWYKEYWSNGQLSIEFTCKNGLMNGIYKQYWSNRRFVFLSQHKHGNRSGIRVEFKY